MTVPFLRWVGGKSRLLPSLLPLLPTDHESRRYVEPFLGGGALFFHLERKEALLSDLNQDLIFAYAAVRDHVDDVLHGLRALAAEYKHFGPGHYYYVRDRFNARAGNWITRSVQFIYLNKTSFNGVWRVNKDGKYNVPEGKFKAGPNIVNEEVVREASRILQDVDLLHGDFESLVAEAWEGDFIYLDPPYVPVSESADFTAYNEGGFTMADQERLAAIYRKLHERGCLLMLSNSSAPIVRQLYEGFRVTEVFAQRSVNSDTSARGPVPELVIRNYDSAQRINTAA